MHDTVWFETQGLPSVFVSTTAFADTAVKQSKSLGLPETRWVLLEHPYSTITDDQVRARAEDALAGVVEALTANEDREADRDERSDGA